MIRVNEIVLSLLLLVTIETSSTATGQQTPVASDDGQQTSAQPAEAGQQAAAGDTATGENKTAQTRPPDTTAAAGAAAKKTESTSTSGGLKKTVKTTELSISSSSTKSDTDDGSASGGDGDSSETVDDGSDIQLLRNVDDIDFFQIIVVALLAWAIVWTSQTVLPIIARQVPNRIRLYPLNAMPIIRLVVLSLAILRIIPLLFLVSFENFLVIAGAASVAIGFAFKDYVSSLIAGIIAVFERPYRPGDWVEIGDDYGEVQSVGMRSLSLQTAADDRITVPHSRLWTENISNSNNGDRTLMCVVDFYVDPDHDAGLLRCKLRDVAMTTAYLNYNRPVLVMLSEEPWGTHYKVKSYPFDLRDQFALISDITVRGKQAIAGCGCRPVVAPYVRPQ